MRLLLWVYMAMIVSGCGSVVIIGANNNKIGIDTDVDSEMTKTLDANEDINTHSK